MRRALLPLAVLAGLAPTAPAHAATVSTRGPTLTVSAAPGEANSVEVSSAGVFGAPAPVLSIRDSGAAATAGPGCTATPADPGLVTCPAGGVTRVVASLGDRDDSFALRASLNARVTTGTGADSVVGGPRADTITTGDRRTDAVSCGDGRDHVRALALDQLDVSCEAVDYGPAGTVGRLRPRTGGGRFVTVPGQPWVKVDRRILGDVLYLVRRYRVRIGDGLSLHGPHEPLGEHPLGLAVDLYPGAGGSWNTVGALARWAEPRQNRPRPPFRWVGYDGDHNHGRGDHLHLSWMHSPGRPGRPVHTVWTWAVSPDR